MPRWTRSTSPTFPEENLIWSYGSGYGGNALLGKKCLALRIASNMARREGWMAEHMLILRPDQPRRQAVSHRGRLPVGLRQDEPGHAHARRVEGWKVECIGDDIAWMKIGEGGRLHAINPESGFFGVAPGTSMKSNPNAMRLAARQLHLHQLAVTDGQRHLVGRDRRAVRARPSTGRATTGRPSAKDPAAHPNARFTAPAGQCPVICDDWENPAGVPIDIFVFGGRRTRTVPLVTQSFDFDHGVFIGRHGGLGSDGRRVGRGPGASPRPIAMLPFCGYNMADYWTHWFKMGDTLGDAAPAVFYVNWFRTSKDGRWLWPGFGENSRVLKWMCERVEGKLDARETAIGNMPIESDVDLSGLDIPAEDFAELMKVDNEAFKTDLADAEAYLAKFGDKVPDRLRTQLEAMKKRLG